MTKKKEITIQNKLKVVTAERDNFKQIIENMQATIDRMQAERENYNHVIDVQKKQLDGGSNKSAALQDIFKLIGDCQVLIARFSVHIGTTNDIEMYEYDVRLLNDLLDTCDFLVMEYAKMKYSKTYAASFLNEKE